MKHISKYIFGVLMFIGFINGVGAGVTPISEGECSYSFNGLTVKAIKNGDKVGFLETGKLNAPNGYTIAKSGEETSKLRPKMFWNGTIFICPNLYINELTNDKEKTYAVTFNMDEKSCKSNSIVTCKQSTVAGVQGNGPITACKYSLTAQGETFEMTVKIKESAIDSIGKLTASNIEFTDKKKPNRWKVYWDKHLNKNSFISADGLNCIHLAIEACKAKEGTGGNVAHWKDSNKKYCDDSKTDNEDVSTDPDYKNKTGTSHYTSTSGETVKFLKKIYGLLKILIPLLVIILSIVDFLKVLFLSDDKNYKEAYSRFIKRIFIGIVLFLVPVLVSFVIDIAGMSDNGILTIFE